MDVNTETHVISEVPPRVIRVVVKDDIVAVPIPAIAVGNVIGRDTEIESSEPEAVWTSANQPPYMVSADLSREVSVFPGMVEVIVCVSRACMTHPAVIVGVNVRRFGMSGLISEILALIVVGRLRSVLWCLPGHRSSALRTSRGNVSPAHFVLWSSGVLLGWSGMTASAFFMFLGVQRNRTHHEQRTKRQCVSHAKSP